VEGAIEPRSADASLVVAAAILALPAAVAFGASAVATLLPNSDWFLPSAMWFMYEASRRAAYVGAAVAIGAIIVVAAQRKASTTCLAWMVFFVAGAITLLWSAGHFFAGRA